MTTKEVETMAAKDNDSFVEIALREALACEMREVKKLRARLAELENKKHEQTGAAGINIQECLYEALAAKTVENEKLIGLLGEMVEEFWDADDCKRSGTSNQGPVHPGSLVAIEAVRFIRSLDPSRVDVARQSWDYVEEDAP
jgi:hypothetical protein